MIGLETLIDVTDAIEGWIGNVDVDRVGSDRYTAQLALKAASLALLKRQPIPDDINGIANALRVLADAIDAAGNWAEHHDPHDAAGKRLVEACRTLKTAISLAHARGVVW
jgi:hypothetical protein